MNKRNLSIFDAGVAFVMAFVISQFTSAIGISITKLILQSLEKTSGQITAFFNSAAGYLLQALFMNIGFVLVFVWYYKRIDRQNLFSKPDKPTLKYFGICVLIGLATLFLLSGTLNYFQLMLDKIGLTPSSLTYELNSPSNYIISLISLAVIPAICEELIFRGVILNSLRHKGHNFAIIFSSVIFAMFHFSPSQLIYPICFGLILAIVYLRTNNILFPMILHFINNALSLSIQYFSTSTGVFTHSMLQLISAITSLIVWIILMIWMFKNFKLHTGEQDKSTEVSFSQSEHRLDKPVFWGSIAIMACVYLMLMWL